MVPHVFSSEELETSSCEFQPSVGVRSVCCGPDTVGGEPIKGAWEQPSPCFMGWHTTDVDAVKEQYNGVNVLRCDPGPGGKCRRKRMKHHAHYENLFDYGMKHIQIDKEDQKAHLRRKMKYFSQDDLYYMGGELLEEED